MNFLITKFIREFSDWNCNQKADQIEYRKTNKCIILRSIFKILRTVIISLLRRIVTHRQMGRMREEDE